MDELWIGDNLLAFDGTVLELFGHPATPSSRWHVKVMELEVGDPDKHGRRQLSVRAATKHSGRLTLEIPAEDWPAAEPFLDRVLAAIP
jgi:hypothetical protein